MAIVNPTTDGGRADVEMRCPNCDRRLHIPRALFQYTRYTCDGCFRSFDIEDEMGRQSRRTSGLTLEGAEKLLKVVDSFPQSRYKLADFVFTVSSVSKNGVLAEWSVPCLYIAVDFGGDYPFLIFTGTSEVIPPSIFVDGWTATADQYVLHLTRVK